MHGIKAVLFGEKIFLFLNVVLDIDLDSEDEVKDERKSLESSRSNEDLEYSTRIKSTISTAAKLSTSQDSIESRTIVKTKSSKTPKKSKGNSNKIMSRVAAIVGFGDKLDEEGKRAIDQDIKRRK